MRQVRHIPQLRPAPEHPALEAERATTRAWLHDRVLQLLEYAAAGGYADAPDGRELRRVVALAADELRAYVDGNAPVPPRELQTALAGAVRDARRVAGALRIRIEPSPPALELPGAVVDALAGAAHEALVNAAKHAGAQKATVRCAVGVGTLAVVVEDDGAGFDPAAITLGLGLRDSVAGRLTRAGGSALVESTPGAGTRVTLTVPLAAGSATEAAA